jgi:hypothetical protein
MIGCRDRISNLHGLLPDHSELNAKCSTSGWSSVIPSLYNHDDCFDEGRYFIDPSVLCG